MRMDFVLVCKACWCVERYGKGAVDDALKFHIEGGCEWVRIRKEDLSRVLVSQVL